MQSKAFIPPRQTTFTYYKIHRAIDSDDAQAISPERWTSNALEGLLTNSQKDEHPPPVDLHVTNLSFVSYCFRLKYISQFDHFS